MTIKTHIIYLVLASCMFSCGFNSDKTNANRDTEDQKDPIEQLSAEIIDDPNDPNLYVKRAMAYRNNKMMQLAIRDSERAIAIDSTVSYFHTVRGELQFQSGELREARLSLEKAITLDDTNTDALLKLAETNFLLRRYEEALGYTNDALRVDDKLAQGYFIKGFVYKELGDTALAISSFQTATEVNPDHYEAYMELGNLSAYQGNPLALEYFNTALGIKPKSAEALYSLGMYLQAGAQYDKALETYQRLINVDPDNFLGYYNTGYLYLTEYGKYETALAYFDTVLTIDPSYMDARYNQGVCHEEMNEPEQAIAIYRDVLEVSPDYTLAAKGLERLLD